MASYTFDTPEDFRREAALVAEQFCERLAQLGNCLLTHRFGTKDEACLGENLPDLFDETASLGRELLLMIVSHCLPAPPLTLIGELYDQTVRTGRLLFLILLRDGEASDNES